MTIYRGLSGPPGPKPQKSLKKSLPGPPAPGPPKSLEKVSKKSGESGKSLEKVPKDFFETFSRLSGKRASGPGRLFSDFFGVSGPEGPRDPCKWSTGSQTLGPCSILFGDVPTTLTLVLPQKYRDTNGSRIMMQIGGVYITFCQDEGILLLKYRNRMGGLWRYFSRKVSGSGVDVTPLIYIRPHSSRLSSALITAQPLHNAPSTSSDLASTTSANDVADWPANCLSPSKFCKARLWVFLGLMASHPSSIYNPGSRQNTVSRVLFHKKELTDH